MLKLAHSEFNIIYSLHMSMQRLNKVGTLLCLFGTTNLTFDSLKMADKDKEGTCSGLILLFWS